MHRAQNQFSRNSGAAQSDAVSTKPDFARVDNIGRNAAGSWAAFRIMPTTTADPNFQNPANSNNQEIQFNQDTMRNTDGSMAPRYGSLAAVLAAFLFVGCQSGNDFSATKPAATANVSTALGAQVTATPPPAPAPVAARPVIRINRQAPCDEIHECGGRRRACPRE